MSPKAKKNSHRELLFCKTQPVVGGWLTSSVILQLDFKEDASVNAYVEAKAKQQAAVGREVPEVRKNGQGDVPEVREAGVQVSLEALVQTEPVWADDEAPWPEGLEVKT